MNVLERSQEFASNITELNKAAIKGHYGIQKKSVISAFEDSRDRFAALREVKDIAGVISAQREFYSAMQKNVSGVVRDQYSFARENLNSAGQLVRAFVKPVTESSETVSDEVVETIVETVEATVEAAKEAVSEVAEEVSKTAEAVAEKAAKKAAKSSKA